LIVTDRQPDIVLFPQDRIRVRRWPLDVALGS